MKKASVFGCFMWFFASVLCAMDPGPNIEEEPNTEEASSSSSMPAFSSSCLATISNVAPEIYQLFECADSVSLRVGGDVLSTNFLSKDTWKYDEIIFDLNDFSTSKIRISGDKKLDDYRSLIESDVPHEEAMVLDQEYRCQDGIHADNLDFGSIEDLFKSLERFLREKISEKTRVNELMCPSIQTTDGQTRAAYTLNLSHAYQGDWPALDCVDYIVTRSQLPDSLCAKNLQGLIVETPQPLRFMSFPRFIQNCDIFAAHQPGPFCFKTGGIYSLPKWLAPHIERGAFKIIHDINLKNEPPVDASIIFLAEGELKSDGLMAYCAGGLGWERYDLLKEYKARLPLATFEAGENPWNIEGVQPFKVHFLPDTDSQSLSLEKACQTMSDTDSLPLSSAAAVQTANMETFHRLTTLPPELIASVLKWLPPHEEIIWTFLLMPQLKTPDVWGAFKAPSVLFEPCGNENFFPEMCRSGSVFSGVKKTLRWTSPKGFANNPEGLEPGTWYPDAEGRIVLRQNYDLVVQEEIECKPIFASKKSQDLWAQLEEIAQRPVPENSVMCLHFKPGLEGFKGSIFDETEASFYQMPTIKMVGKRVMIFPYSGGNAPLSKVPSLSKVLDIGKDVLFCAFTVHWTMNDNGASSTLMKAGPFYAKAPQDIISKKSSLFWSHPCSYECSRSFLWQLMGPIAQEGLWDGLKNKIPQSQNHHATPNAEASSEAGPCLSTDHTGSTDPKSQDVDGPADAG